MLEQRFRRHQEPGDYLKSSLLELGFSPFAQEGFRLPMLSSIVVPDVLDDAQARRKLLNGCGIEVGIGLGKTNGKIWGIGLMGETCKKQNVETLLSAIGDMVR
jgi:alanine-glyoxylate transaminase / serine-glyoxylate transaminase / serine-pyruvate transaminase